MSRFLNGKFAALAPYVPGEQPRAPLIKLNTNESPFPPSPMVVDAITRREVENLRLYPDPDCDGAGRAIAAFHGVSPDNVMLANGSDELLAFAFHAFCESGAVFPDITYGFYRVYARMFSVAAAEIPLRADFSLCPGDYAGQAGTVFLANPNAPTGMALGLTGVEALLKQDANRLVVVDEAYVDFGADSALALLRDYDNLLVLRTFSKSRSLAGARLGYAVGSEALIADMRTMKFSFNPYSVSRLALVAAEAAMGDTAYFEACRKTIIENRAFLTEGLRALGFTVLDSRANFIFCQPPTPMTGEAYQHALRERGVLVRRFQQPRVEDYVRISIGTREQLAELMRITEEIL